MLMNISLTRLPTAITHLSFPTPDHAPFDPSAARQPYHAPTRPASHPAACLIRKHVIMVFPLTTKSISCDAFPNTLLVEVYVLNEDFQILNKS